MEKLKHVKLFESFMNESLMSPEDFETQLRSILDDETLDIQAKKDMINNILNTNDHIKGSPDYMRKLKLVHDRFIKK